MKKLNIHKQLTLMLFLSILSISLVYADAFSEGEKFFKEKVLNSRHPHRWRLPSRRTGKEAKAVRHIPNVNQSVADILRRVPSRRMIGVSVLAGLNDFNSA